MTVSKSRYAVSAGGLKFGRRLTLAMMLALTVAATHRAQAAELVMFEKKGCVWCAVWNRDVALGYGRSTEGRRAPLRRVELANQANSHVALQSRIDVTPTFLLVNKGREVGRITG